MVGGGDSSGRVVLVIARSGKDPFWAHRLGGTVPGPGTYDIYTAYTYWRILHAHAFFFAQHPRVLMCCFGHMLIATHGKVRLRGVSKIF